MKRKDLGSIILSLSLEFRSILAKENVHGFFSISWSFYLEVLIFNKGVCDPLPVWN